ncbi:MAG: hypothetical protein ACLPYS_03890 [Vulcanimicrobiaceae bacterium]
MKALRAFALVAFALFFASSARAQPAAHDSRKLSASERATFIVLVCLKAVEESGEFRCAHLIGHPESQSAEGNIALDAIAYGSFTAPAADQAYVTYDSMLEPHADNFGGGILFERTNRGWKLVRWFPGGQLDDCLALPGGGRQKMLCLSGYTGQGETDSTVSVQTVSATSGPQAQAILQGTDLRGASDGEGCGSAPKRGALLLSIDTLRRAEDPGFFAESGVSYATAQAVAAACTGGGFEQLRASKGVVRFRLTNGAFRVVTPLQFARSSSE